MAEEKGWIERVVTKGDQKFRARCKHTPNALDGKDFHCVLSPESQGSKEEEGSGLGDGDLQGGQPDGEANSVSGEQDTSDQHTTIEPLFSETTLKPFTSDQHTTIEPLFSGTTSRPFAVEQLSSEPGRLASTVNKLSLEPGRLASTVNPGLPVTAGQPPENTTSPDQNSTSGMADEQDSTTSGLCSTLDDACRKAIGHLTQMVLKKKLAPVSSTCDVLDERCNRVKKRTLFPPGDEALESGEELLEDPCKEDNSCASWGFFRTILAPFLASLKSDTFGMATFPDDKDSLWSVEGARLHKLAMARADDQQELGLVFVTRLIYKAQLETLTQGRLTRLELNKQLDKMLYLSVGLSLPSILLSVLYLSIHLRWAIKAQREKRAARQTDRDHRLLNEYQRGERGEIGAR